MIEPVAGAKELGNVSGIEPATAAASNTARAGGVDFGEVYADEAAPPEGGCQCDRQVAATARTGPAASVAVPRPTGGASAWSNQIVTTAAASIMPSTAEALELVGDSAGTCGSCGLPFVLPDATDADSGSAASAPIGTPLAPFDWTTTTSNWLVQALGDH